jgi:hypothetical protein
VHKLFETDPASFATRLLQKVKEKQPPRPAAVVDMTVVQLEAEKADLKKVLREFETRFAATHRVRPGREDKLLLKTMYGRLKEVKSAIAAIGTISSPSRRPKKAAAVAVAATQVAAVGSVVGQSAPKSGIRSERTIVKSARTPVETVALGGATALGSVAGATPQKKYEELKVEKKTLQRSLNKFKADFKAQHGRDPGSKDREHMKGSFVRYKELKGLLTALEKETDGLGGDTNTLGATT